MVHGKNKDAKDETEEEFKKMVERRRLMHPKNCVKTLEMLTRGVSLHLDCLSCRKSPLETDFESHLSCVCSTCVMNGKLEKCRIQMTCNQCEGLFVPTAIGHVKECMCTKCYEKFLEDEKCQQEEALRIKKIIEEKIPIKCSDCEKEWVRKKPEEVGRLRCNECVQKPDEMDNVF